MYANARQLNGLSAVEIGDAATLESGSYQWRVWWLVEVVRGITWLSALLGLLCLAIGFILRRESAFIWFGLTCLGYAASNMNVIVTQPPMGREWFAWLAFSSRLVSLSLLYTATLSLFSKAPAWCKTVSLTFAVLVPFVVWLSGSNRTLMMVLFGLLMLMLPVLQVAMLYWVRSSRNPIQILVLFLNFGFFVAAIADWLRLGGMSQFEGIYLTTYAYGVLLVLFCATLLGWLASSLGQSRSLSVELVKNLQDKSVQIEAKNKQISHVSQAIKNAEAMALKITESLPVGIYATYLDAQGVAKFSFVSERFLQMLDLQRASVLADLRLAVGRVHPEDQARFIALNNETDQAQSAFFWEGRYWVRGEVRWMRVQSTPRFDASGQCVWDGMMTDITDLKEAQQVVQELHAQLLNSEINRSRSEERERMLQDLHDGFGSELASARLLAEKGDLTQDDLHRLLEECLSDLYLMVDTLGNSQSTLQTAVAEFRYRIQQRLAPAGLQLHWDLQLDQAPELPSFTALQTLRITQEAINNIVKHANAKNIRIAMFFEPDTGLLHVQVADDGVGFAPSQLHGRGQGNMRNRARKMGAELAIISAAGEGATIQLQVPLVAV